MVSRDADPPDADLDGDDEVTDADGGRAPVLLVDGRYRLIRLIAKGGMSVVHLAEHVALERQVALKVLRPPPAVADQFDFARAFKHEARTLASFQHPHVVVLHDFGRVGPDAYFLAMEYVDGPSVSQLLKDGPLSPTHAVTLALQAALALRYTHQRGIVHKDVKPSNLLITQDDAGDELLKVIDFGIAGGDLLDDADLVLGSPDCISPEQVTGAPLSPATDVYSLGVVLYRMLTGAYPYRGARPQDKMVAHVTAAVPRLSDAAPDRTFAPALDAAVRRCLAKDPADRYGSMDELIADLASFLELPAACWSTGAYVSPRALQGRHSGGVARSESTPIASEPLAEPTLAASRAGAAPEPAPSRLGPVAIAAVVATAVTAAAGWWLWPAPPPAVAPVEVGAPASATADDERPATQPPAAEPAAAGGDEAPERPEATPKPPPEPKARPAAPARSATPPAKPAAPEPAPPSRPARAPEGYKGVPDF